jgi:putative intracellular protease/amidase
MASKKILVVASNYGVWAEELQAPWDILTDAGHQLTLATYKGKTPLPLKISVQPDFVDPIQDVQVNPPEVCRRVEQILAGGHWSRPIKLADARMADYDAIVMAGGFGADLDMTNNPKIHQLILDAIASDKLVAAICFAVGALAMTRDPQNGYRSVIAGKRVTAHPRDWDFTGDVTYELYQPTPDNRGAEGLVTPGFLLAIEALATDAVGPSGTCVADPKTSRENPSVVYDWPFITGCSVESSIAFGRKIVEVLASR